MKAKRKPSKLSNLYLHIKEITLDKFITAHCEKDLSVLIKSGKATPEQLTAAWDNLYRQFIEKIGDTTFESRLDNITQYNKLRDKILRASYCLELATSDNIRAKIYEVFNTFGYAIPKATDKNIDTLLKKFESYLKLDIVKLKSLQGELEKTVKNANNEPKEDDYYSTIFDIQEALSVRILPKENTVLEYCVAVQKLNKHIERLIKQNEKNK